MTNPHGFRVVPLLALGLLLAGCVPTAHAPGLTPATQSRLLDPGSGAPTEQASDVAELELLRTVARDSPDDAAAQERLAAALERARLYPEALTAVNRAVALGGAPAQRLQLQGRIALEAGELATAAAAYRAALAAGPPSVGALSGLGITQDLMHRHAEAQALYDQALRLSPSDWGVRSNLAMSLMMSGKPEAATEALANAGIDPTAPRRARHDLALALVAAGRRDQAIRVLQTDMPAADATALADEFAAFARWLAGGGAGPPG
jgi:Flp pilus assembly protein TadD